MAKAERAVAFHRKLVEQGVVCLTSELEDKLSSCEEMLNAARAALGTDVTFKTAHARCERSCAEAQARKPLDGIGVVLDHVECFKNLSHKNPTLCSFALCSKTFYSLAQARLLRQVELDGFMQILQFAYALELQPKDSKLPSFVRDLSLVWNFRSFRGLRLPQPQDEAHCRNNRLIHMFLATCPSITALTLLRMDTEILQNGVDALDGFLRLTPQLESLTFHLYGDSHHHASFGAEDLSIVQVDNPDIVFRKGTTDKLRQLRAFELRSDSDHGSAWSVIIHCLGPALCTLELWFEHLQPKQLLQIANSSPHLVEVIFGCVCPDTYADVSRFFKVVGPTLTKFWLSFFDPPEDETETCSVIFESLTLYAKAMEIFKIESLPRLDKEDVRMLAHPECLPRLRELTLSDVDRGTVEDEQDGDLLRYEEAIEAVLESHRTTLELISFDGHNVLLGNVFARACLRLHRVCCIEGATFAPETSLTLLERLYRAHHQKSPGLLQCTLDRLSKQNACSACLLVNGAIVSSHTIEQCPEAFDINLTQAKSQRWLDAEQYGYCAQCFPCRPLCLRFDRATGNNKGCQLESTIRPLITFLAAQDTSWNIVGASGEPAYWGPLLRSLLRIERAHWRLFP